MFKKAAHSTRQPADTAAGPSTLDDVIDERLAELEARHRDVTAEILNLESTGAERQPGWEAPEGHLAALRMLAGDRPIADLQKPAGPRLDDLYREREAIDLALAMGQRTAFRVQTQRAAQIVLERENEVRELLHEQAMTVAKSRRLKRQLARLRVELTGAGMPPSFPGDGLKLLGDGSLVGDEGHRFLQQIVAAGIATNKEIENA